MILDEQADLIALRDDLSIYSSGEQLDEPTSSCGGPLNVGMLRSTNRPRWLS